MKIFQVILCASCFILVLGDCYRELSGCRDQGKKKSYKLGQKWKPKADLCYSCKCIRTKVTALTCKVAVEDKSSQLPKKNALSSKLETLSSKHTETSVRISRKEAKTKTCPPIRAPTYNWVTGQFEMTPYKTIRYFYYKKEAKCCSRFLTYTFVHPSCKVVKIGKCRSKVVKKSNPKKSCKMPMSLVG